ncbi:MAG: hypothetical protein OEM22_03410 [Acidimicrobiia bacterium]|nr:hypothetical protein [Acidimicrobiia bacterium]
MTIPRREEEAGFTSLQFAVLAFFMMLIFAAVVNLVAMQYQRGAVRVAVDEGARHGASAAHSEIDCEQLATSIIRGDESGLLRGQLGESIDIECVVVGTDMVATAVGSSAWWIGGLPDLDFAIEGRAVSETFREGP